MVNVPLSGTQHHGRKIIRAILLQFKLHSQPMASQHLSSFWTFHPCCFAPTLPPTPTSPSGRFHTCSSQSACPDILPSITMFDLKIDAAASPRSLSPDPYAMSFSNLAHSVSSGLPLFSTTPSENSSIRFRPVRILSFSLFYELRLAANRPHQNLSRHFPPQYSHPPSTSQHSSAPTARRATTKETCSPADYRRTQRPPKYEINDRILPPCPCTSDTVLSAERWFRSGSNPIPLSTVIPTAFASSSRACMAGDT